MYRERRAERFVTDPLRLWCAHMEHKALDLRGISESRSRADWSACDRNCASTGHPDRWQYKACQPFDLKRILGLFRSTESVQAGASRRYRQWSWLRPRPPRLVKLPQGGVRARFCRRYIGPSRESEWFDHVGGRSAPFDRRDQDRRKSLAARPLARSEPAQISLREWYPPCVPHGSKALKSCQTGLEKRGRHGHRGRCL